MSAVDATQAADPSPPWWASLPQAKAACPTMDAQEVMSLLESSGSSLGPADRRLFLLVDVRRADWAGGTIESSINLPAQSFYQTRPIIFQLCKQAGIKTVIFYCG